MSGNTGKTSKLAAAVLLFVNLIVMVFCTILFAFSLWIISSPETLAAAIRNFGNPVLKSLLSQEALSVHLGVAVAALSIFLFFLAFMGFYGALSRSPFLLFMYSALVLLLLMLECALIFYFSSSLIEVIVVRGRVTEIKRHRLPRWDLAHKKEGIKKGLQKEDGQWTHALRLAFQCCEYNETLQGEKPPWSCCGTDGYPDNCLIHLAYRNDCQSTISSWLHRYQTAVYASLAVVHILLSFCSLVRRMRSLSRSHS